MGLKRVSEDIKWQIMGQVQLDIFSNRQVAKHFGVSGQFEGQFERIIAKLWR